MPRLRRFFATKYRIRKDKYQGYEVQRKDFLWPWWYCWHGNTQVSSECCEEWLRRRLFPKPEASLIVRQPFTREEL